MAAKKKASSSRSSSKKSGAAKTPAKASKASKVEERRPAVAPGDLAGAEYNPARTPEGERVAQTGANPRASRAGVLGHVASLTHATGDQADALKTEIAVIDGSAQISINGKADQAGVLSVISELRKVVQETH